MIDDKQFEAFMLAVHEHGPTGLGYKKALEAYEAAKQPSEGVDAIERKHQIFEEWALREPALSVARDGDGEYESATTRGYWKPFEFGFNRGVQIGIFADVANKINGELSDRVAELEKQLEPVDDRLIGCLIHDNLNPSKQKHENTIAIYDAIRPYLRTKQPERGGEK